jgi:hypothetical protein
MRISFEWQSFLTAAATWPVTSGTPEVGRLLSRLTEFCAWKRRAYPVKSNPFFGVDCKF